MADNHSVTLRGLEVSFYRDVRDKQARPVSLQQVYEWIQSDAYTMAKTMAHRAAVESGEMGVAGFVIYPCLDRRKGGVFRRAKRRFSAKARIL